jgi:predicted nucleic acid-binding protein
VNDHLLSAAGVLLPADLRSLDALHLVTARHLGSDLRGVVTYDARMAAAGKALGLRIVQPR